ncbi:uncharacterized protein LOC119898321 isoform X1 [Micropterus salmoides]|uniref:uncharacterized protein LOC119898321 isoform X1 n=1 Tax=Micropterus salmoides TaxID=27706 RepID=UPI0018EDD39A|nr:uncharacterized protein LOC119898321 isoform X1 [Micropterus salmoides]
MDKEGKMMICCLLLAAISPVFSEEWKATVVKHLDVLVSSCVVIPCSFTHPKENLPASKLRKIWHRSKERDQRIYHEDSTLILENFRGRTRLVEERSANNCTLEITEIKDHDNGPFCFRIELARTPGDTSTIDKFSFVEDCVEFTMLNEPPKPTLIHAKTAIQDHPYTVTCSVTHTCPSHVPKLTWSRAVKETDVIEVHKQTHAGHWEAGSILTFIPEEKDDHSELTCTSQFYGQKRSYSTLTLYVKRKENYNHIIIPSVVGIGITVIFGVFCSFMVKKYKTRISELQSQDGSMWNRLSRMSRRIRSDGPGPSRSDQRRSVWSRFSRRPKGDMSSSHMPNNDNSKSCADQKFAKARFPSPKSQPKSCNYKEDLDDGDDYVNTEDLNVYGNI